MGTPTVRLQPADRTTVGYVEQLLERNDLPADDVREAPEQFFIASDGPETVGVGGLEVYGTAGLLRSLVVERSARGAGYGTAICRALEARARDGGVETLYILTAAAPFFAGLGYEQLPRRRAPVAIQQTREFADLCPDSATCLRTSV